MSVHWGGKGPGHVSRWPRGVGAISPYSGATMLLDFLNPVLDPRITFSRGTGATRVNQSGFIETVGNTTPRFDYDPVTLAPRGLLIEEARTNLLTYSQDWTNAAWPKTNITATAAATASPDGTINAQRIAATATAAAVVNNAATAVAATSATFSVYVKQGTGATVGNYFGIRNNTTATTLLLVTVNLTTGAVLSYINGTTGVFLQNVGNGWWRLTATVTSGVTSGDALLGYVGFAGQSATAGDHLFAYGAQLEAGSFATSYIPTVASTVTRNADVATMTGTNFSSWFNQTEGTFVADVLDNAAGVNVLVASDGTTTNQLIMTSSTLNIFSVFTGGAFQAMLGVTPPAPYKSTGAYKVNDFAAAANGGTVSTDTSGTLATYSRLSIGANAVSNAAFLNGHIRTIAYFNTRLPNAQLQTLTAPSLATTLSLDFTSGSYNVGF